MTTIEEKRLEQVTNAWKEIRKWSKENLVGVFPRGFRIDMPHNPYWWKAIVVNPYGEIFFFEGSHGTDHPERILLDGTWLSVSNGRFCISISGIYDYESEQTMRTKQSGTSEHDFAYHCAESLLPVVKNWQSYKERLLQEAASFDCLENFKV